jgi:hypothetical protein
MGNGGRFLWNNDLNVKEKTELIELFADLVDVPKEINRDEERTYQVIPKIKRRFAEGARLHSGIRLLRRSVRHAMDPKAFIILLCKGNVIKYENKTGLLLVHKVKASMKPPIYDVQVAFTAETMISCSCTCKAGSCGVERVLCVHILPVLTQICQAIFCGMGEHILVETANFFANIQTNTFENNDLLSALRTLVRSDKGMEPPDGPDNIRSLLYPYSVGTERSKSDRLFSSSTRPTKNEPEYVPFRYINRKSAFQKAKEQQQQRNIVENNVNVRIQDPPTLPFHMLHHLRNGVSSQKKSKYNFFQTLMGFQLLFHRAKLDVSKPPHEQSISSRILFERKKIGRRRLMQQMQHIKKNSRIE